MIQAYMSIEADYSDYTGYHCSFGLSFYAFTPFMIFFSMEILIATYKQAILLHCSATSFCKWFRVMFGNSLEYNCFVIIQLSRSVSFGTVDWTPVPVWIETLGTSKADHFSLNAPSLKSLPSDKQKMATTDGQSRVSVCQHRNQWPTSRQVVLVKFTQANFRRLQTKKVCKHGLASPASFYVQTI